MYVSELTVADYRNYNCASVRFSDKINFIVGNNAQGKTNLLEAVYLCSVGTSARTSRDKELINHDKARAIVRLKVKKHLREDRVEIILDREVNKRVAIGGLPVSRIGELMGVVTTVFFSPDEMRIVKEGPADRRKFMNIALCQMSKAYFYLLKRYNKILVQRNKLLKSGSITDDALDVWDMQLAESGAKIINTRRGFVNRMSELAGQSHDYLTDGKEVLELEYESLDGDSVQKIYETFMANLKKDRERDRQMGYTHCGAHKDDISFKVCGKDIRTYGSQGQQRTVALAVKLAEIELFATEKDEYPVLLLDDVLSELDIERQKRLLSRICKYQTLITCTHIEQELIRSLADYTIFEVKNGTVKRQ